MTTNCSSYTIELGVESLIDRTEVCTAVEGITGHRPHENSVNGWWKYGVRGVRLPTVLIGGRRYTSREGLAWWIAATRDGESARPARAPKAKTAKAGA